MKKVLLATILLTTVGCQSAMVPAAKTVSYFAAAPYIGPAIVLPELLITMSEPQREYNKKHGITHSRDDRGNNG